MKQVGLTLILIIVFFIAKAGNIKYDIVVAKDGSGHFSTIGEAIESLPMYCYERVTIFIKEGVYNEKFKIDRDYITLIGENRETTRIECSILREHWIDNKDDIGPAVINIYSDDVVLKNLTIVNTQPEIGPHAFAIYGKGTRTILKNCTVLSNGGDTVSLWDYKTGMYYHDSCHFQGAVDFVCPRGWCYISNSSFYEVKKTAAVWHAAPTNDKQKFVLKNCDFQGADSFYLARHHYDAQFYFIQCTFPEIMQNKSVEHVVYKDDPQKNRPYLYGDRYYYYECSRTGGNFSWFANNLAAWPQNVTPATVTPAWTFDQEWNPIDTASLKITNIEFSNESLFLWFDELVMPVGNVELKSASGTLFTYYLGSGRNRLEFKSSEAFNANDLGQKFCLTQGGIQALKAAVIPKEMEQTFINLPLK